jgi:molybdopterin/thiamine biosynthesis adenylyltransferase
MKWAIRDPKRFLRERSELDRLEQEVDWLSSSWRIDSNSNLAIEVDIDLLIHGRTFAARLTYPEAFPDTLPYIRPRDGSERWTAHQYGAGGSLCLQWRADNWHSQVTGADLVRSAFELLSTEQHPEQPGTVPSAHRVTEGQSLRGEELRFVGSPGLLAALTNMPAQSASRLTTHTLLHGSATVVVVSAIAPSDGQELAIADVPGGIASYLPLFTWKEKGRAFRSNAFNDERRVDSFDALLTVLANAGFAQEEMLARDQGSGKYKSQVVLLVGMNAAPPRAYLVDAGEQPAIHQLRVLLPSAPRAPRLPAEHEQLEVIRFGIVGLGSIGSKVAVSLARSGARRFLLVDDDFLKPENLCRHELSWASVGVHKANAVCEELSLVAAGIKADVRLHRLAGQESAVGAAAALNDLAACDVLIDATANPEAFLLLAGIAKANRRALCWGELFAGGYGGLVARSRPDSDPNPVAVRTAIHDYFARQTKAPYQHVGGYDGDQEQPLIAYDSEVGQIATLLTQFAIDAALKRNPSQFPYPAYAVGLRKEWIFEAPFDTHPIEAQGRGWDDESEPSTDADRDAVVRTLLGLIEKGPQC